MEYLNWLAEHWVLGPVCLMIVMGGIAHAFGGYRK